jgi:DNA-binding MarR family transcriptional regulator
VKRKDAKSRGRERKESPEDTDRLIAELAAFRYSLRKFMRFSENAARSFGITPQQHQLMLGVAGYTGRGSATVSELAEFLQERLHSVVGLVERAEQRGLIQSRKSEEDRRVVVVSLTASGRRILRELSELHRQQAASLQLLTGTNSRSSGSG